ncbi:MAG TPA: phage portal protein [Pseudonocardiaceae bacterium]|jgi:HK97 family phage portal protein
MGLGRRQYRAIGPIGGGNVGPLTIGGQLEGRFNGGFGGQYGGSQANMWTYRGAMRIPAVWKATLLVAELLAQVQWDTYTEHGRDDPELISPRPMLLEQPAPPDTQFTTFRSGMMDYIHDGNAILIKAARNPQGTPTAVWPVPASWVGVRRIVPANALSTMLPIGSIEYLVGSRTFGSDDVIHIKGPCAPGALRGAGVLEMFLDTTFETAHEQEREAQKMARHGVPAGILRFLNDNISDKPDRNGKKPMTMQDRMRNAADQWLAARDHSGVAVMNSAVDFKPLAWNPDQMQMIEARQFTLLQLANIMRVPPKFVGASTSDGLTYATSETGGKELLRDTMGGYFTQWEQTLSLVFPRGTKVKANLDEFLKSDQLQRYQANLVARQTGWKLNSEIRVEEHMPPIEGIDDAPTALVQKKLNTELPITDEGYKQILGQDPGTPVQAQAQRLAPPQLPAGNQGGGK